MTLIIFSKCINFDCYILKLFIYTQYIFNKTTFITNSKPKLMYLNQNWIML